MTLEEYIRAFGSRHRSGIAYPLTANELSDALRADGWRVVKFGHEIPWSGQVFRHVTEELS